MRTNGIRFGLPLALIWLVVVLLSSGCLGTTKIKGQSMEPTMKDGEIVIIDRNALKDTGPQRGDIILYEFEGVSRISRVIGLAGETITVEGGIVYVNGNKLNEPYLASGTRTESATREFHVPGDSYFVLGDNRGKSRDSRVIGFISRNQMVARVLR